MERVKLLTHHVALIKRAIEEGRSPEEEVQRQQKNPNYITEDAEEIRTLVIAHQRAYGAIQRGDFIEIDETKRNTEYVSDIICKACPPSSKAARACKKKVMVQALSALDEALGGRDNLTREEVTDAHVQSAKIFFKGCLRFELRRRGLA